MKAIKKVQLTQGVLTLSLGNGFRRIALVNASDSFPSADYPISDFTLQEVETIFINLITKHKEQIVPIAIENMGLGFVSQSVSKSDTKKITDVLTSYGLKDLYAPEQYHFSLCYDKRNIITEFNEMDRKDYIKSSPVGMKLLTPDNASEALSLVFKSEGLEQRVQQLNDMGFVCMYGDFIAHISVKYSPSNEDVKLLEDNIDEIIEKIGDIFSGVETWDIFQ